MSMTRGTIGRESLLLVLFSDFSEVLLTLLEEGESEGLLFNFLSADPVLPLVNVPFERAELISKSEGLEWRSFSFSTF